MPPNMPGSWPDPDADWLWDRDVTHMGIPAGTCYFRGGFTLSRAITAEVWAAGDDSYDLWLDGVKLLEDTVYVDQAKKTQVSLDAGAHTLAARVTNDNNLRGGLLVTVMELDPSGTPVGAVARTDSSWLVLAYPASPPGFTPGEVIRILVEEAQTRGALVSVTLDFDDALDTAGDPWPVTGEIAFPVGADLLTALKQLAETYGDLLMTPRDLELAFYSGGLGAATAVTLAAGVNLTGLHHDGAV